jgi:hypothetical protein
MTADAQRNGSLKGTSLKGTSINRLACLVRHWTWADEARLRFERELGKGWEYDEDPPADHLFGAYYHWCALLCGFGEAALEHGFLSAVQLEALRSDLERCLPELQACRQVLVVIPASREGIRAWSICCVMKIRCAAFVVFTTRSVKRSAMSNCPERPIFSTLMSVDRDTIWVQGVAMTIEHSESDCW